LSPDSSEVSPLVQVRDCEAAPKRKTGFVASEHP
jgi:hypothetical protein